MIRVRYWYIISEPVWENEYRKFYRNNQHITVAVCENEDGKIYRYSQHIPGSEMRHITFQVPDYAGGKKVVRVDGSCGIHEFFLNPENEFMKCADNVIFSRDGKRLMSYARYDTRSEYTVPNGTEVIEERAFENCNFIKRITFPDFNVKIDRSAFGEKLPEKKQKFELCCPLKPRPSVSGNVISWDRIESASYYAVCLRLGSGKYKTLSTIADTSCKVSGLKQGDTYTLAVKPVAAVSAVSYNADGDKNIYPDKFVIEGTMSEDITVIGK